MDFLVFSTAVGIVITALVSAYVLSKNPQKGVNRSFFVLGLASALWGVSILLRYDATGPGSARVFYCSAMFFAMATPFLFLHFTWRLLRDLLGRRLPLLAWGLGLDLVLGLALFVMVCTPLGMHHFAVKGGHYTGKAGPVFYGVIVWGMATALAATAVLAVFAFRAREGRKGQQMALVAAAPLVPVVLFGILELALRATETGTLVGEPYFTVSFFSLFIAYGVTRLDLMSITPEAAAAQILESLPDGLVLLDPEGRVRNANPAFLALTAREETDVAGTPIFDLVEPAAEGNRALTVEDMEKTARWDLALRVKTADQEPVPVSVTIQPVRSPERTPVGTIMVFRDLRPLRHLETELFEAEKLAGLGRLAAGVAHEINNPLSVVMGLSELGPFREDKAKTYFEKIHRQAERTKQIVDKLLLFARRGTGVREDPDLAVLLDEAVELVKIGLKADHITVTRAYDGGPFFVPCDPDQLRQVFRNLVQNAFQAIQEKGFAGEVTLGLAMSNGVVRVQVADTGPGIAPSLRQRVFDPFFTTKGVGRGTGLGLSIAHGIVASHRGRIYVESLSGEGAVFVVELPAGEASAT